METIIQVLNSLLQFEEYEQTADPNHGNYEYNTESLHAKKQLA